MENEELIKQVTEKAEKWLTPAYDAETQAEIKKMLANPDKTDLIEAFYKDLEFGTGGLRGIMPQPERSTMVVGETSTVKRGQPWVWSLCSITRLSFCW